MDHVSEVENTRHEVHEKLNSLANVGMTDLHLSLRSALGISDPVKPADASPAWPLVGPPYEASSGGGLCTWHSWLDASP